MPRLTWATNRGMVLSPPPVEGAAPISAEAVNIDLLPNGLGIRRKSLVSVTTTGGPTNDVGFLYRFSDYQNLGYLLVMSGSSSAEADTYRLSDGAWQALTLSDTVTASYPWHAASLNGKVFTAYNSNVNRLHVLDTNYSAGTMRRVGIEASSAPTLADLGSGGGAAVIRYYKVQFKVKSGSNVLATSELSAAASITPAGAFTVRVTKPTTPDSATHWVVFGSADGITYYDISTDLAVATTTFDDSAAPSAYSTGTVAPTVGLYVPPPSCKFLVTDGARLIMAGAWESSASSTQTTPKSNRVWFTQVLGALDNTGEDEAIPQTADTKFWVDVGDDDGDSIVGLSQPIFGSVLVFKKTSIWVMEPTGIGDVPYRVRKLISGVGAKSNALAEQNINGGAQPHIANGQDRNGNPCVYFQTPSGEVMRAYLDRVESVSEDLRNYTASASPAFGTARTWLVWNSADLVLESDTWVFNPTHEYRDELGRVRGGWVQRSYSNAFASCACMGATTAGVEALFLGGGTTNTPYLSTLTGVLRYDRTTGTPFSAYVTSPLIRVPDLRSCRVGPVIAEYVTGATTVAPTATLTGYSATGVSTLQTLSETLASPTVWTSDYVAVAVARSLLLGDCMYVRLKWAWDSGSTADTARYPLWALHAELVPEGTL